MTKHGLLEKGMANQYSQYSCLENPMNSMKRQKDMVLKDELPRLVGAQYATGEEWRNNSRKEVSFAKRGVRTPRTFVGTHWTHA